MNGNLIIFLVHCFSFFPILYACGLISLNISYREFLNPFIISSHGFLILFPRSMNFEMKQCMHWTGVKAHTVTSRLTLTGFSSLSGSLALPTSKPSCHPKDPMSLPPFRCERQQGQSWVLVPQARDAPPSTVWHRASSFKSLILFLMSASLFPWKPSGRPHSCPHCLFLFPLKLWRIKGKVRLRGYNCAIWLVFK